jgi:hypothetical protein
MAAIVSPIINEHSDSKLIKTVLDAVIEGIGGSSVPTRALAEAMIVRGAAALAARSSREEAVQVLRAAADHVERQS